MTTASTRPLSERTSFWPALMRDLWEMPDLSRLREVDRIRVEEVRQDDAMVIRAELPGIDPDRDIQVTVRDGMLEIRAHRERREQAEDDGRVRSEFHYGDYARRVPLAPGVHEDDVTATYRDGILEVRAPLPADVTPEPRQVTITRT